MRRTGVDPDLTCRELVELVTDYLEGALPATERDSFEAHVAACPGCEAYIEQFRSSLAITRCTWGLELGGNDAGIVLYDAQLDDAAIERLVVASHLTSGQVCMGLKRLYVHRSRYREVVDRMSQVLSAYIVGHGLDPEVTMGPLNSARQRDFVTGLKAEAADAGHEVREFGTLQDQAERSGGHFLLPRSCSTLRRSCG